MLRVKSESKRVRDGKEGRETNVKRHKHEREKRKVKASANKAREPRYAT